MKFQDKIIAGHFGFKYAGKIYYYVPVYDHKFKDYGPGQYLLMSMIKYYNEQGYGFFDFLRGTEDYKLDWANSVSTNYRVIGVPKTAGFFRKLFAAIYILRNSLP